MTKRLLILFCLLVSLPLLSQEIERTRVQGKIIVPEGDNPEGMTVFNETSQRGTITNTSGEFKLSVAVNDSVSFSALQFQKFTVVVDKGIIESGEMNVFIRESITELPEVVVLPHDLSGNINVDVNRIAVTEIDLPNYSAADLERMNVRVEPDSLTGPGKNDALGASQTRLVNGLNFVNIFKALVGGGEYANKIPQGEMDDYMRRIYDDDFFSENLDIELDYINDFIFYATDHGLTSKMMEDGNELDLIEFLIEKSEDYKQFRAEN